MIYTEFLIYLTNLVATPNPMLLMAEGEDLPIEFCSGTTFSVSCIEYSNQGALSILDHITTLNYKGKMINPVILSDSNNKAMVRKINEDPLAFSKNGLWLMPIEYMSLIDLRLDSKIFFYSGNGVTGFTLYEGYAIKGRTITNTLDVWYPDMEALLDKRLSNLATNILGRRSDLFQTVLMHSWFEDPPYMTYVRDEMGQVMGSKGYNSDLLNELKDQMNFSIENVPAKVKTWGKIRNGSWIGIVGMLVDKDIDVSAHGILMKTDRLDAIDFCWPTNSEEVTLMTTESTRSKLNIWVFMDIFPLAVWAFSLALIILGSLFFSLGSKLPLSESFALMIRLGLQMGYEVLTPNKATKVLLLVSSVCLTVVFVHFTCDLTTRMTVEPPKPIIRSFEDVIEQGYMVVQQETMGALLAEAPKDSPMREVSTQNLIHFENDDKYITIKLYLDGHWGDRVLLYGVFDPFSQHELEKQLIGLQIEEAITVHEGVVLQKDSEFKELFNHHIMKLYEVGVIDRLMRKNVIIQNEEFGIAEAVALGYENVLFPFGIIFLGMVLAVVAIVGEGMSKLMGKLALEK